MPSAQNIIDQNAFYNEVMQYVIDNCMNVATLSGPSLTCGGTIQQIRVNVNVPGRGPGTDPSNGGDTITNLGINVDLTAYGTVTANQIQVTYVNYLNSMGLAYNQLIGKPITTKSMMALLCAASYFVATYVRMYRVRTNITSSGTGTLTNANVLQAAPFFDNAANPWIGMPFSFSDLTSTPTTSDIDGMVFFLMRMLLAQDNVINPQYTRANVSCCCSSCSSSSSSSSSLFIAYMNLLNN